MKLAASLPHRVLNITAGLVAFGWATILSAQIPGKAEVRAIKGSAVYTHAGGAGVPLKVGILLYSGDTVKTSPGSVVDLFLGNSAGFVRVTENTTLTLDKLAFTETGADTVVEIQMNLPDGTILGNVNKLSAASKYEVKVPNGVAGIRGTRYRISSSAYVVLLDGSLIMVYVPPAGGGNPIPYPMFGPPEQYFSPTEGVKPAPPELVAEFNRQLGTAPSPGQPGAPENVGTPVISPNRTDLPFVPPSPTTPTGG